MQMIDVVEVTRDKSSICRRILLSLPEWFGIPEAIESYAADVESLLMVGALLDAEVIGFLAVRFHTKTAAEAYVLAVRREWHRTGIGRSLFDKAEAMAAARGARFMTVTTIAATVPDPHYTATRRFYEAIGFLPIEIFPTLWGPHNPCLLMLKPLHGS
jgi:ribosomal protein S18 acetylase RimI-like enzyme